MTKRATSTPESAPESTPEAPAVVRVVEGEHRAIGRVVGHSHDGTLLDVAVDLWGVGRELTLFGVAPRAGGNGWEPV